MRAFDAADVVYNRRTAALIKQVLDDNDIGGQVIQSSSFLQNLGWMQPSTVAKRINSQAGRGAGDGASTEPRPGRTATGCSRSASATSRSRPGEANRLPAGSNVTFNVKIANQGENAEQDVRVRVRITGAGDPITRRAGRRPDAGRRPRRPSRSSSARRRRSASRSRSGPRSCRSRREEHREQLAELPGDLPAQLTARRGPGTALPFGPHG